MIEDVLESYARNKRSDGVLSRRVVINVSYECGVSFRDVVDELEEASIAPAESWQWFCDNGGITAEHIRDARLRRPVDCAHSELPGVALSIRQPWAWAIIHGGKDVENRAWGVNNPGLLVRGRIAIHASNGLNKREYYEAREIICDIAGDCPRADELNRGGVVGAVTVSDVRRDCDSPWFSGPVGLILKRPEVCAFIPVSGCLGFFDWRARPSGSGATLARWMVAQGADND